MGGGKVQGVTTVTTVMVKFTDGHGKSEVRIAAVIPGGEIYFFTNNAVDPRPAQQWLKAAILKKLGKGQEQGMLEIIEDLDAIQV